MNNGPVDPGGQWHTRPAVRIGEIVAVIGMALALITFLREYDNRLVRLEATVEAHRAENAADFQRLYSLVGEHAALEAHVGAIRLHAQEMERIGQLQRDVSALQRREYDAHDANTGARSNAANRASKT